MPGGGCPPRRPGAAVGRGAGICAGRRRGDRTAPSEASTPTPAGIVEIEIVGAVIRAAPGVD